MKYDCHIFLKYAVFQMKILVIQSKNENFDRNTRYFKIKKFEILGFLYIESKILGISSEILSIPKTWHFN